MPQIVERKRQDGSIAYVAQINIRRNGKWAHRESRTFDKHSSAAAWFKKRMKEITAAGADLSAVKSKGRTLSTAIDRYITESVKAQIPPLNTVDWEVEWNEDAAAAVDDLTRTLAQKVLEGRFVERGQAARELDMMMRMKTGIAKASAVAGYVDLVLKDAPRVLLAGWHRDVYGIWQDSLQHHNPVLYTGTESPAKKRRNVEAFINGDSRVMMISLRSGAGLDGLQEHCSDVVFGELDWSPQVHKQVAGRLRRPGQTKQVTAHYLHTHGGSDPIIMDILGVKSDQSRGITDPTLGMEARQKDDSRMRKLAMEVLGMTNDLHEPEEDE